MNDDNNDNPFDVPGMKRLELSAEEMDYLSQRWEVRDHRDLLSWGIKLLYDLSKLDEAGWRFALQKCDWDMENKKIIRNPEYNDLIFLIEWLSPRDGGFMRLPLIEVVEKITKVEISK